MAYLPSSSTIHPNVPDIHSGGWLATREQRRAAKEVTRMRLRGAVVTAREVTKVEAIADVAGMALLSSSEVSRIEAAMSQGDLHGDAGRRLITASANAAMASVVKRTGWNL